jgi:hypothetical protein
MALTADELKTAMAGRAVKLRPGAHLQSATNPQDDDAAQVRSLDTAQRTLLDFDPRVASAFVVNQVELLGGEKSDHCAARALEETDGYFILRAQVQLQLDCAAGRCSIARAELASDGDGTQLGPESFAPCYNQAVEGRGFDCPGCREGRLAVSWPIGRAHVRSPEAPPGPGSRILPPG